MILEGGRVLSKPSSMDNLWCSFQTSGAHSVKQRFEIFQQATSARLERYNRMRSVTISANLADLIHTR